MQQCVVCLQRQAGASMEARTQHSTNAPTIGTELTHPPTCVERDVSARPPGGAVDHSAPHRNAQRLAEQAVRVQQLWWGQGDGRHGSQMRGLCCMRMCIPLPASRRAMHPYLQPRPMPTCPPAAAGSKLDAPHAAPSLEGRPHPRLAHHSALHGWVRAHVGGAATGMLHMLPSPSP